MTFTLNLTAQNDLTDVRMHIGDVDADAAIFSDEHINYVLGVEGTVSATVIALLCQIIAKLSAQPDLKADWLNITLGRSVEGYKKLLAEKRAAFGVAARTGTTVVTYRGDSLQTEAPDW
jgi:hypothetical protein